MFSGNGKFQRSEVAPHRMSDCSRGLGTLPHITKMTAAVDGPLFMLDTT